MLNNKTSLSGAQPTDRALCAPTHGGDSSTRAGEDLRLAELIAGLGDLLVHDCWDLSSLIKGGLPPHRLRRVLEVISSSVDTPQDDPLRLDQLAAVAS